MKLFIDNNDGFGLRDFSDFLFSTDKLFASSQYDVSKFTIPIIEVPDIPGWILPGRGAFVRIEDEVWQSRTTGVADGVLWTGVVTEEPTFQILGVAGEGVNKTTQYGYTLLCSSEDYSIQNKQLPAKTFINKHRGEILKATLQTLFADNAIFPFDLDGIENGGIERVFQIDPGKTFNDIVEQFAKADNYLFYVLDRRVVYTAQTVVAPDTTDPRLALRIDPADPRFNSDNLDLQRVSSIIKNDVTVLGEDEGTAIVRELFVSNGADPFYELAAVPFVTDVVDVVSDDLTGDTIDASKWDELDDAVQDYIRPFQGSLNIVGGSGTDGKTFLLAKKGLELSGVIYARDGELSFPPSPSGQAVLGGLYTAEDGALLEADLFCGWYLDASAHTLTPIGPAGHETPSAFAFNPARHYILRRIIQVDQATRSFQAYTTNPSLGDVQTFTDEDNAANATITWSIEEIDDSDVHNVVKTTTVILSKSFLNVPAFVVYSAIVSYSAHCILNFVSLSRPQQVIVNVDGNPILLGSYLDGGRATITVEGEKARLSWYAIPVPEQYYKSGGNLEDVVTIPKEGSQVEIVYRANGQSRFRSTNQESIDDEAARFGDNGVRQIVINSGEMKPAPRTSEECQFLAQAYLADRRITRYQGTYKIECLRDNGTELVYWPMPGDLLPLYIEQPIGTIDQLVSVSQVSAETLGNSGYRLTITFGPMQRFERAQRQLMIARKSSVDDPSIETIVAVPTDLISSGGMELPDDPAPFSIQSISSTAFTIRMDGSVPPDVAGYEVRVDDTGWGKPNYIARFTGATHTFARGQRDVRYFVRPFNADGNYSRRSALSRVVYPLQNTMVMSGVDGTIAPDTVTVTIPFPDDFDFAGVQVRQNDSSGAVLYEGNGVTTHQQAAGINALAGSGHVTITIPNSGLTAYVVWVVPYNIIRDFGTPQTFTVSRTDPALTLPPTSSLTDPNVWSWAGFADSWGLNTYDSFGNLLSSFDIDGDINSWNIGDGGLDRYFEVIPRDDFGDGSSLTGHNDGDTDVPAKPGITVGAVFDDSSPNGGTFFSVGWDLLYAGPGHINMTSADYMVLQYSRDSLYSGDPNRPITTVTLAPAAQGGTQVNAPLEAFFFRIKAHNAFGDSEWSNVTLATTGSALDALAPGGVYDFNQPTLHTAIKMGPTGFTLANANDGTGRSLSGLSTAGDLSRDLLNARRQFDTGGVARSLVNVGNNVSVMANGTTVEDGSTRARNSISSGFLLSTNIINGFGQFDGGGSLRTLINVGNNVSALANGGNVETGAGRALNSINSGLTWVQTIAFGARWFDNVGFLRQGYLLGSNSIDDVGDGGTYARTQYFQRDGGSRAFSALDGSLFLVTGLSSGFGVISVATVHDGSIRGVNALDGGGSRVSTDRVDGFSIRIGVLSVQNISGTSLGVIAPGASGGDDIRYI